MLTEHAVPIFGGAQGKVTANLNFNFYASQCRIHIEIAFGLMTQKWGILHRPLNCNVLSVWQVVVCIAKLHNYCINARLARNLPPCQPAADRVFTVYEEGLRAIAAVHEMNESISNEYPQWSRNRERLVERVASKQLKRPQANMITKA